MVLKGCYGIDQRIPLVSECKIVCVDAELSPSFGKISKDFAMLVYLDVVLRGQVILCSIKCHVFNSVLWRHLWTLLLKLQQLSAT